MESQLNINNKKNWKIVSKTTQLWTNCVGISITLYNVILRIARNFLETRENIKISTHPFYHINLDWFWWEEKIFFRKWPTPKIFKIAKPKSPKEKKNCFIPIKISSNLYGRMDGSNFWCFPWFTDNSLPCVILLFTVYPQSQFLQISITNAAKRSASRCLKRRTRKKTSSGWLFSFLLNINQFLSLT